MKQNELFSPPQRPGWSKKARCLAIALILASLSASVLAQPEASENPNGPAQLTLDDLRTFAEVFNQVRRNYIEEVDDRTLLDAAIKGMLSELDPHSRYLPGRDYDDLNTLSRGRASGIGAELVIKDQRIVVRSVIDGSPADKAGINPGDIVTGVDGEPVKGRKLSDVVAEITGQAGTEVKLQVSTPEQGERQVDLQREELKLPTLNFELLGDDIAYYRLSSFHRESAIDLKDSLQSVTDEGQSLSMLIIDLRRNSGGVLQPAIAIADGFLESGTIVATRGRNSSMQLEFTAEPGEWLPGIPLIVLVDRTSASASEVLAAALQDHDRATIIGERTFGKGSVQSVLPLRNGSGIKLTTARYYTPNGRSLQAEGVRPDIRLEAVVTTTGDGMREADLEDHLENDTPELASMHSSEQQLDDPLVSMALAALREGGKIEDLDASTEGSDS